MFPVLILVLALSFVDVLIIKIAFFMPGSVVFWVSTGFSMLMIGCYGIVDVHEGTMQLEIFRWLAAVGFALCFCSLGFLFPEKRPR